MRTHTPIMTQAGGRGQELGHRDILEDGGMGNVGENGRAGIRQGKGGDHERLRSGDEEESRSTSQRMRIAYPK